MLDWLSAPLLCLSMSGPCLSMLLLSVMMMAGPGQLNLSPSYSYYPDYGDDYDYYDQSSSAILSIRTVLVNGSFTVDCLGMVDMKEKVQLLHNGQEVEVEEYSVEVHMSDGESVHSVQVERAALTDSGKWSCVGSDSGHAAHYHIAVLPAVDLASLVMDGMIILNQSMVTLREGTYIQPVCGMIQLQGHHHPSSAVASWSLGDEEVSQTSQQLVSMDTVGRKHITSTMDSLRVERAHTGARLVCSMQGQSVGIELQVEHEPEFTIRREPGFGSPVMSGMTVSLLCEVEAVPASHPYWEKNGMMVSNTWGGHLLFTNVSVQDEGWYQCSTNHKFGNFSSVGYFLSVKEGVMDSVRTTTAGQVIFVESQENTRDCNTSQPIIIPPTDKVYTQVGNSVILSIRFCSNPQPTTIFWVGPQVLLKQGEKSGRFTAGPVPALQGDMCGTVTMEMEQVELKDRGEYLLVVRNKYGIQEGVMWLEVTEGTSSAGGKYCDIIITFILLLGRAEI